MRMYYEITVYPDGDYVDGRLLACSNDNPGILSPEIDKEINTSGTLSFTILPNHPEWGCFRRMVSVIEVIMRDQLIFRGRVIEISEDNFKQKSIKCEGALGWLVDNYRPKSKDVLENMKAYVSSISKELEKFNALMEECKQFSIDICEPAGYTGNLIEDGDVIEKKYYSKSDGETLVSNNDYSCNSSYIDYDNSKTYKFYSADYSSDSESTDTYYCYGANSNYLGYVGGSTLNSSKISSAGMTPGNVHFIRVSGKAKSGELFWLTTTDSELEGTSENEWGGGTYADFFSDWLKDSQHMIFRSHAYTDDTTNFLDVLNPNRRTESAEVSGELIFGNNMIEITRENVDIQPYSIIYPIFEGAADPTNFPTETISSAVTVYGNIVKEIDFGKKPSSKEDKVYKRRMAKIKSLYDPTIPSSFVVKALDESLIFDNEEFMILDVGDVVSVKSESHDIDENLLILSMKIDLFNPSNNEYKLGQYVDDNEDTKIKAFTESFTKSKKKNK